MRQIKALQILIITLLAACGTQGQGSGPTGLPNQPVTTDQPDATKPTGTEAPAAKPTVTADQVQDALYLDNLADLGTCDASNKNQLVYVAEDSQFHSCSAKGWIFVSIKGKDGTNGTSATMLTNSWYDDIANRTWYVGASTPVIPDPNNANSKTANVLDCPTGTIGNGINLSGPVQDALQNGLGTLFDRMNIPQNIMLGYVRFQVSGVWHQDIYVSTPSALSASGSSGNIIHVDNTITTIYRACYKDGV